MSSAISPNARSVQIALATTGGFSVVIATVVGNWAVHKAIGKALNFCDWMITHVPTGRCIGGPMMAGLTELDAIVLAEAIDTVLTDPMAEPDGYWILLQLKFDVLGDRGWITMTGPLKRGAP